MKKIFIIALLISFVVFTGCDLTGNNGENSNSGSGETDKPDLGIGVVETPVTENLIENDIEIISWNNKTFNASYFEFVKAGDVIEIKVIPSDTYSRVYLYNTDWKNYYFENVTAVPKPAYIQQEKTDDDGNKRNITKIALDYSEASPTEYTITIKLNTDEADKLKNEGLLLTGDNYVIKSIKASYTKKEISSAYSLEEQYELYSDIRKSVIEKYSNKYDLPIIYITTKNQDDIKKKEYYDSVIDVVNCDSEYNLPDEIENRMGGVKVRGNSTASDENYKPYRIKFNKKNGMLGLHNGKKYKSWVLLKTGWSMASDYVGFNLAHEIYKTSSFDYYASDATFVHVLVNGSYKGLYLLCEQNQVNKGRVDVAEPEKDNTDIKTGYMIELDNYAWEDGYDKWISDSCWKGNEDYHFKLDYKYNDEVPELTDINNVTRTIPNDEFTLKSNICSQEQIEFIQKYTKGVWDICYSAIEKGTYLKFDEDYNLVAATEYSSAKEACSAVIDMESLVNEMILEELVRDNDVGAGSLYMAVDFTKGADEKYHKLTFECPWDFNWAYSDFDDDADYYADKERYFAGAWQPKYVLEDWYEGRSNSWFVLFNKTDWFREMQREKWDRIGKENLNEVLKDCENNMKLPLKEIKETEEWMTSQSTTSWVSKRISYIDKNLWK